jgi:hypothetical protein
VWRREREERVAETCVDITAAVQSIAVVYLPSHREKKEFWSVETAAWSSSRVLETCDADSGPGGLARGRCGGRTAWLLGS